MDSNRGKARAQNSTSYGDGKAWQTYEEVAAYVLEQIAKEFGISTVDGKQKVKSLRSGTEWEIDARAVRESDGATVIVECRRKKRRLTQEALAAVAYRIQDTGAGGAITVSPLPLQKGAAKVAEAEGVRHLILDRDSTPEQWHAQLEDLILLGFRDTVSVSISEHLNIKVLDENGRLVEERDIYG